MIEQPADTSPRGDAERSRETAYRSGYRSGFDDGYEAARGEQGPKAPANDSTASDDAQAPAPAPGVAAGARDGQEGDARKDARANREDDGKPPLWKRPLVVAIALVVVIAALVGGVLLWRHAHRHATTDDAFVDGQTSQLAAQAAGRVTRLYVHDNEQVAAGAPILDIDAADVQARLDQAQAQVTQARSQVAQAEGQVQTQRAAVAQAEAQAREAQAEAANAQADLARFRAVDPDAVAPQQRDAALERARTAQAKTEAARAGIAAGRAQVKAALAQAEVARAHVATALADLQAARLQLGYTHVVAPIAGRVTKRAVEVGNVISVGQPLLAIVSGDLWVTANYKETQLTHMRPGQPAQVVVDAYPDVEFPAHIDSIQRATGAYFSMLPSENATGNYVKVVQRVPVKIVFDHPEDLAKYAIGPGMSVKPDVRIR